jgi:uncharacterized protein YhbP (UPF0306 family)
MTMGNPDAELELPQHVLDYLDHQKTLTLATASASGVPRATTLLYVSRGPALYLWVRPDTTTAKHVEQNPVVSFAIDEYAEDWRQTRGIQGNGECEVVLSGEEIARAALLFGQKFPDVSAGSSTVGIYFLKISPTQVEFIDNSRAGEKSSEEFGVEYRRETVLNVFSDLPQEAEETFGAELQTMQVDAGDVVVRQGGPADKFFIVVDGELEVLRDEDGEEHQLATLGPGQLFGEIAIMRDTARASTLRAIEPATLLAMDRDTFRGLVAQSLGTTGDFDQVIQQRLERLGEGDGT